MKKTIITFTALAILLSSCSSDSEKKYNNAKETIAEREAKNPLSFLKININKTKENLIGQTVIKGTIVNQASTIAYKDVEMQIDYYSKTGSKLGTEFNTVFETIAPNGNTSFKYKSFGFKGADSTHTSLHDAKVDKE
jgi:PBP1b-binding outer membrane lipoprotein LpoB